MHLTLYATRSGGTTLDRDEAGGNPFASALIEIARDRTVRLRDLPDRLHQLTLTKSGGHQTTECLGDARSSDWTLHASPGRSKERREALLLIVSDYSNSGWAASLDGAAHDERRIAAALAEQGFSVTCGIRPGREALLEALSSFRRRTSHSDVALIYATGHGFEDDGDVYLLPGDFPRPQHSWRSTLRAHAVSVKQMVRAARGRDLNLVFFAGCRSAPDLEA